MSTLTSVPQPINNDLFTLMCNTDKKRAEVHPGVGLTRQDERRFWFRTVSENNELKQIQEKYSLEREETKRFFVIVMIQYEKTRKWWNLLKQKS